jgi:hypothetical protein
MAEFVTAPGVGGGPLVEVWALGTGGLSMQSAFNAYDPTFVGGVFVAIGDVNGDGALDVITGSGTAPHVEVISGSNGSLMNSFMAFDSRFVGGVRVAVTDLNQDGRSDLIVAPGPSGGTENRILDALSLSAIDDFFAFNPNFLGGIFPAGNP